MKTLLSLLLTSSLLVASSFADSTKTKPPVARQDTEARSKAALEKHVESRRLEAPGKESKLHFFVVHDDGKGSPEVFEIAILNLTSPRTEFNVDIKADGSQVAFAGETKEVSPRRLALFGWLTVGMDYKIGVPHGPKGGSVMSGHSTKTRLDGWITSYGKAEMLGGTGFDDVGKKNDEQFYAMFGFAWL